MFSNYYFSLLFHRLYLFNNLLCIKLSYKIKSVLVNTYNYILYGLLSLKIDQIIAPKIKKVENFIFISVCKGNTWLVNYLLVKWLELCCWLITDKLDLSIFCVLTVPYFSCIVRIVVVIGGQSNASS